MRILLIENEEGLLKVWTIALTRTGHEVVSAHSIRKATEILLDNKFDLIISDFYLDDGDFNDLKEIIDIAHNSTKVLVISGLAKNEVKRRMSFRSDVTFLEKPVSLPVLFSHLEMRPIYL